ncbi:Uncharacterised protein [uncultured archaeon]|nr:Uncharacterised protein [uncultured archaeon]
MVEMKLMEKKSALQQVGSVKIREKPLAERLMLDAAAAKEAGHEISPRLAKIAEKKIVSMIAEAQGLDSMGQAGTMVSDGHGVVASKTIVSKEAWHAGRGSDELLHGASVLIKEYGMRDKLGRLVAKANLKEMKDNFWGVAAIYAAAAGVGALLGSLEGINGGNAAEGAMYGAAFVAGAGAALSLVVGVPSKLLQNFTTWLALRAGSKED